MKIFLGEGALSDFNNFGSDSESSVSFLRSIADSDSSSGGSRRGGSVNGSSGSRSSSRSSDSDCASV